MIFVFVHVLSINLHVDTYFDTYVYIYIQVYTFQRYKLVSDGSKPVENSGTIMV